MPACSNYVFASSCSVYGFAEGGARREGDPVNPLTAYARSKIGTEDGLRQMELGGMSADLPALRDRLRHVGAAAARPRAQRFRRRRGEHAARSPC